MNAKLLSVLLAYPDEELTGALPELREASGQLPRAEAACGEVLALPANAELTADEVARVCDEVRSFFLS